MHYNSLLKWGHLFNHGIYFWLVPKISTFTGSTALTILSCISAPRSHPLNSSGYAINSTHIALNWSAPHEEDLNGILREYRINYTEGLSGIVQQLTTVPGTTELVIGPLHPFYIYHCTILAYTIEGGPSTDVISIRTHEDGRIALYHKIGLNSMLKIIPRWARTVNNEHSKFVKL